MAKRKVKAVLKPYKGLSEQFTQVSNSMILHIEDTYTLKIYMYLCMRYNKNYDYSFPSLETISSDCKISIRKVKYSIKWLSEKGYIVKGKFNNNSAYKNNVYYIRYLYIDKDMVNEEMMSVLPNEVDVEIEIDVPDELL